MTKKVQKISSKLLDEMYELSIYAFNSEKTEARKKSYSVIAEQSKRYGFFVDNQLASQVFSTPFIVNFHGTHYSMAGIGNVSSYPEYRGQGGISAIMRTMLQELAEEQVELSYLAPFSYPFYRNYGYEQVFEKIEYTIKAEHWPNTSRVAGAIQRVSWEQAKEAQQSIYEKNPINQRGGVLREDWWLQYFFSMKAPDNLFAVYRNERGEAEGYLVYQSSYEAFVIKEWDYLSGDAFKALAGFIGSHNGATQKFVYKTGFDGQNFLSYLLPNPYVETRLEPYMMARIVNLKAFIEKYPFSKGKKESYQFAVTDKYGPWNEGHWELDIDEQGKAKFLQKGSLVNNEKQSVFQLSIQQLTQLFMGYKTFQELSFYHPTMGGEVEGGRLQQRLVQGQPVLQDYF